MGTYKLTRDLVTDLCTGGVPPATLIGADQGQASWWGGALGGWPAGPAPDWAGWPATVRVILVAWHR